METDSNDLFRDSCARYIHYPDNLLRKVSPNHRIKDWQERLNDDATKSGLFDDNSDPYLGFLELRDGRKGNSITLDTGII